MIIKVTIVRSNKGYMRPNTITKLIGGAYVEIVNPLGNIVLRVGDTLKDAQVDELCKCTNNYEVTIIAEQL